MFTCVSFYYVCYMLVKFLIWGPRVGPTRFGCQSWLDLLQGFGWKVRSTHDDSDRLAPVVRDGVKVERRRREDGFQALGTMITFDNRMLKELQHREAKLWRALL